jgi:hypothetical protein
MAFKVFTPGVLTSSDVNTFLMRQSVIVCTSTTRPASPNEGMTIYETDTDRYRTYSGTAWENLADSGAWRSWTPTLGTDGSGTAWALGNATTDGRYLRIGRQVIVSLSMTFGSTTTFGSGDLMMTVPASLDFAATVSSQHALGVARFNDISLNNSYPCVVMRSSNAANVVFSLIETTASYGRVVEVEGATPVTWVSGDTMSMMYSYETSVV